MRARRPAAISAIALSACLLGGWAGFAPAQARTKFIYSFVRHQGGLRYQAASDLAADAAGNLYGTTVNGGDSSACSPRCGTAYRLVAPATAGQPWTPQTLTEFEPSVSGIGPSGRPVLDRAGNIYGVSGSGGTTPGGKPGDGTVWKLSPPAVAGTPWTLTVLYTFSPVDRNGANQDGAGPVAGVVLDGSGTLYGITSGGGSAGKGVVYALTPPAPGGLTWTEKVLHTFTGIDDTQYPSQPLTLAPDGTTLTAAANDWYNSSGAPERSSLFQLRRDGSAWTYHRIGLPGGVYGHTPSGRLVVDRNGNIFGTCVAGGSGHGGVAYELSPPGPGQAAWTEQVLSSLPGTGTPRGGLIAGGSPAALFGGTVFGGSGNGGVVFRLDPPASGSGPWTYTVLHDFSFSFGSGGAGGIVNGLTFGRHRLLFGIADQAGRYGSKAAMFAQTPR